MSLIKQAFAFAMAAGIAAQPPVAAAAEKAPIVLQPASQWQLDYGEDRCRLARLFGTEEQRTIFWMEQTGPASSFSWLVAGWAVDELGSRRKISAKFGPKFESFDVESSSPTSEQGFVTLASFGKAIQGQGYMATDSAAQDSEARISQPRQLSTEEGAAIDYVEFKKGERTIRLNTQNLADGFKAMNDCAKDLFNFWGIDPDILALTSENAELLNIQQVAQRVQAHYPSKAERRGDDAILRLKVLVDATGAVTKCITIKETEADNFDEQACEIFRRYARYEPAEDGEGTAVPSLVNQIIVYTAN